MARPRGYKLFSAQLSMTFSLLIYMKMPTKVGIFIFISIKNSHSATQSKQKMHLSVIRCIVAGKISCSAKRSTEKFNYLGAWIDNPLLQIFEAALYIISIMFYTVLSRIKQITSASMSTNRHSRQPTYQP